MSLQSFIQHARVVQSNTVYAHHFKKMLKQRSYRLFLQRRTAYLPDLHTLKKWRNRLGYLSLFSLAPASILTVLYWPAAFDDIMYLSYELTGLTSPVILSGSLFLILASFAACFDWALHRRYNKSILFN